MHYGVGLNLTTNKEPNYNYYGTNLYYCESTGGDSKVGEVPSCIKGLALQFVVPIY
jgi:hypothetical protein